MEWARRPLYSLTESPTERSPTGRSPTDRSRSGSLRSQEGRLHSGVPRLNLGGRYSSKVRATSAMPLSSMLKSSWILKLVVPLGNMSSQLPP